MDALRRALRGEGAAVVPAARWRVTLASVLASVGLGISVYLTVAHFVGGRILICSGGGAINCEKVTTSPQSYVFGIPVAVLGLAYYVVMSAMSSPWAWRARDRRVHLARLVLAVVGIGFVLYLISAELLIIKAICLWCTGVHIVTFAQLILVLSTVPPMLSWGTAPAPAPPSARAHNAARPRQAPRPATTNGRARAAPSRRR